MFPRLLTRLHIRASRLGSMLTDYDLWWFLNMREFTRICKVLGSSSTAFCGKTERISPQVVPEKTNGKYTSLAIFLSQASKSPNATNLISTSILYYSQLLHDSTSKNKTKRPVDQLFRLISMKTKWFIYSFWKHRFNNVWPLQGFHTYFFQYVRELIQTKYLFAWYTSAKLHMSLNKQLKQDIYINLTHVLMCSDWNNPVSF